MTVNQLFLYVDPGSGSYLVQAIIAAVLGAMFYFRNIFWRIKAFFFRPKKEDTTGNDPVND
ncbi:hypothetical protein [Paraflavitalea pollutisoli]|uniref:hypothetical protein n=1 Tax=Paraflavitalea pollutisoli TaxID=3034143 RepID=UPI0023EDBA17|nr:hypothetical protein [Paraflavitalea sp. H1-2-19X]